MDKIEALARLRAHERDLRAMGIERLSIFGSTARGDTGPGSDVELAATLATDRRLGVFHLLRIERRLSDLLETSVDLVTEPSAGLRLQGEIDRDRVHVF